jgi:uncharacterized membrane protein YccC
MAKIKFEQIKQPFSSKWIIRLLLLLVVVLALALGYYFELSKLYV